MLAMAIAVGCTFVPWMRAVTARAQARRRDGMDGTLTVDEWGVTRVAGQRREAVAWKDLVSVRIRTTSDGPAAEDMFFVLSGADGTGCVQERLPGLDNKEVARAAGVCREAWFTIWTRAPRSQPDA
ncbi:MAG TPA: hypothetical protein VIM14_14080 [Polyangia bacterium]